jgi:simple sugar transport system ATP-binding protein
VAEMDEALEIADRILVMFDHTVIGDHRNQDIDLKLVLAQVAGQQSEQTGSTEYAI